MAVSNRILIFCSVVFTFAAPARAALESVTITSDEKFPAPRWMFGQKEGGPKTPRADAIVATLTEAKKAQLEEDYDLCLKKVALVRPKAKSLQAWLATVELDCAEKAKATLAGSNKLAQALARVAGNPSWLLKGPQAQSLRAEVIDGYLELIDQDLKINRARAWKSIESVQDFLLHMDRGQKARLWKAAGDLAFVEQKPDAAADYLRRSLNEVDANDVRQRVLAIEISLGRAKGAQPSAKTSEVSPPEASADELQISDRVTTMLKSGEIVSAVEDAIRLIQSYPGSSRAKWASDRILEAYTPLIDKADSKYTLLRERIVKLMEKGDVDRQADWARWLFGRGQYADAFQVARRSLGGLTGVKRTGVLDLAAKAALASDKFDESREYSQELVEKHSGTREAREATFRLGLLQYRNGKFAEAAAAFEKVTLLPQSESLELSARYWLWRSYQKIKSDRAKDAAAEIVKRFPFSYYGLRARFESLPVVIDWKIPAKKIESQIWLTSAEKLGWERMMLLLKSGWLEEAQAELRLLPPPSQAEDKALRALLWSASGQYLTAAKLVSDAWDEKTELRGAPFVEVAFPAEYDSWISEQAKARSVDKFLVKSLIKQESGFNARAVSASNALGLMQMIPPTAKEIAQDLRAGPVEIPADLFQPKKNIQFGTFYLSRLIGKYQGMIPLALAAYNAGQGRIDRWIRSRPSLKNLSSVKTSAPDEEIWIDEIPYAETCFYVKAILRNLLIYRSLANPRWGESAVNQTDESRVQETTALGDPLWAPLVSPQ